MPQGMPEMNTAWHASNHQISLPSMCLAWLASTMSGVQRLGLGLVLHLIMAGVSRAVAMAALWCLMGSTVWPPVVV